MALQAQSGGDVGRRTHRQWEARTRCPDATTECISFSASRIRSPARFRSRKRVTTLAREPSSSRSLPPAVVPAARAEGRSPEWPCVGDGSAPGAYPNSRRGAAVLRTRRQRPRFGRHARRRVLAPCRMRIDRGWLCRRQLGSAGRARRSPVQRPGHEGRRCRLYEAAQATANVPWDAESGRRRRSAGHRIATRRAPASDRGVWPAPTPTSSSRHHERPSRPEIEAPIEAFVGRSGSGADAGRP